MDIFEHEDSDGDGFYLRPRGNTLKFRPWGTDHSILAREDVVRLRDALTEWLGDGETPSTPAPMDPEMVRGIVREMVREIVRDELASRIPVPARPIKASLLTEEAAENIWGRPCVTCGHTTSVHFHDQGCEHPDGCECAWPDTSAPAPEKCEGCTQGSHPHVFAKCSNCECTDMVGAPAPEPAGAPQCTCTHPYLRRHSDEGCAYRNCPCTFTGSAPAPEPASAPECGCPHRIRVHDLHGCTKCECTWTGSAP